MRKIIISVLGDGTAEPAAAGRAAELAATLCRSAPHLDVETVIAASGVVFAFLDHAPDVVVAVGYGPADLCPLAALSIPVIWDLAAVTAEDVAAWTGDDAGRTVLSRAIAAARGYVDVSAATALAIEDKLNVGLSSHGLNAALAAVAKPVVVAMGTGLGNMIYAVPMVRWLSERLHAPIDLVIHERFDEGVTLFARAPWLNAVYPGYEYLAGRGYDLFISTVTAGAMRPPFNAKRSLWVDQERDYNEEGRFIHETRLNFLGLEAEFGQDLSLMDEVPLPFIRDIAYVQPKARIVGIANGKKSANWAKREWGHMDELTKRLIADGWEVRSFGLADEYVEGAVNLTGIPIRDMLHEIGKCAYFISYDGGIAHMAEAIGVPTIWLFGSTEAVKNGPALSHAVLLKSERPCRPCLHKIDWVRCAEPACMEDIALEDVLAALATLEKKIAREGYKTAPARTEARLLTFEADSLQRPGPRQLWDDYLASRTAPLPQLAHRLSQIVLRLIMAGDLVGAESLAKAAVAKGQDNLTNRFLRAAIEQVYGGPTPIDGLAPAKATPISEGELAALVYEFGNFDREESRTLLSIGIRLYAGRGDRAAGRAFLSAVAGSANFSKNLIRPINRALDRLYSIDIPPEADALAAEFDANPSLQRMRAILSTPVAQRLDAVAETLAAPLSLTPDDVKAGTFAPHLAAIRAKAAPLAIPLDLGDTKLTLAHNDVVLVIVPHVLAKNALPGSTSALIAQQMTRLATIGLRPVVVTVGHDDVTDGWTIRDSVTYIQAHRCWPQGEWSDLVAAYAPAAVFAYGSIEEDLDLPADLAARLVRISLDGLYDRDGLLVEFAAGERWAPALAEAYPAKAGPLSANRLSNVLFVPPQRQRQVSPAPLSAMVLMPDARDFQALIRLVTTVPSVRFTALTGLSHRGVEKNLRTVAPGTLGDDEWHSAQILLQFSTRPVTLAAETISWIERGGRCIANPAALADGPLARAITRVAAPDDTLSWIQAFQAEAALLAGRRRLVLTE